MCVLMWLQPGFFLSVHGLVCSHSLSLSSSLLQEPEDIDGDNIDDLPLPPPPPPIPAQRSGEPQYADIPILAPPPPPANVEDDMEKHATSSFLASLGGSFGGFLGEDELLDEVQFKIWLLACSLSYLIVTS